MSKSEQCQTCVFTEVAAASEIRLLHHTPRAETTCLPQIRLPVLLRRSSSTSGPGLFRPSRHPRIRLASAFGSCPRLESVSRLRTRRDVAAIQRAQVRFRASLDHLRQSRGFLLSRWKWDGWGDSGKPLRVRGIQLEIPAARLSCRVEPCVQQKVRASIPIRS